MSDKSEVLDADTMKFGLLMESAQAHQKIAESHLERLRAHTRDLDCVVRDEIRRTLVDELGSLSAEAERVGVALRQMNRAAAVRGALWNAATAVLCIATAWMVARWILPSRAEIESLRLERDALSLNLNRLRQLGGRVEWQHCGDEARLCVRVDRQAPAYGEQSDYRVLKGY